MSGACRSTGPRPLGLLAVFAAASCLLSTFAAAATADTAATASGGVLGPPQRLRVEGLLAPVAVLSEATPRFSFVHPPVAAGFHGTTQSTYRITVAALLPNGSVDTPAWDSGEVVSSACTEIEVSVCLHVYVGTAACICTCWVS